MGSTRLPGKVMKLVLNKPLLQHQIERLCRSSLADDVVVATTTNDADKPIVSLCRALSIRFFRGPEDDVLTRYFNAATTAKADNIVRVTSDCPLLDPRVVDRVIRYFMENQSRMDYVSNTLRRTYPRGMDCEVFPMRILQEVNKLATSDSDREHVTSFIYRHPDRYRLGNVACEKDYSQYRWTVDTPEDFALVSMLMKAAHAVRADYTLQNCIDLMEKNPTWAQINAGVIQKPVL
jgi:spore coat polysaccharide biosynthesis protein SpsF